jgi:hypothetical protein
MSKKIACIVVAVLMGATPALAQNAVCVEPTMPVAIDGKTASHDKMLAAISQTKDFVAKSDVYQQCIADDLEAKKQAAAKAGTPFDEQVHTVAMAKVAANQQAKDKLVADTNTQVGFYKQQTASK